MATSFKATHGDWEVLIIPPPDGLSAAWRLMLHRGGEGPHGHHYIWSKTSPPLSIEHLDDISYWLKRVLVDYAEAYLLAVKIEEVLYTLSTIVADPRLFTDGFEQELKRRLEQRVVADVI